MKCFFLSVGLLFFTTISFSQTNTFPTTGNAGVGTLSPENADGWGGVFEVHGSEHAKFQVSSSNVKTGLWSHNLGYYGAPVGGFVGTSSNHSFSIITNQSPKVTVLSNGNLGIGTLSPYSKLAVEVDANKRFGVVDVSSSAISDFSSGGAGISFSRSIDGVDNLHSLFSYMNGSSSPNLALASRGDLVFAAGGTGTYNLAPEVMRVVTNGNVGIGTASPTEKLSVNGKIRAKEIKVENSNWPDYVFLPSYKVPTLQEIEKHIKEKGHLPGIPSASEVKANGVDLGDMNAKLLQKIEELTLHLIEKEKLINNLLKRVESIEQTNKSPL